jgi:DNA-binding beta-propeller fold protein YncE
MKKLIALISLFSAQAKAFMLVGAVVAAVATVPLVIHSGYLSALSPATVATGSNPGAMAETPDGKYAFVVNAGDGTVSSYSVTNGLFSLLSTTGTMSTAGGYHAILVSSDGKYLYVLGYNVINQFSILNGVLTSLGTATSLFNGQSAMALAPNGLELYSVGSGYVAPWGVSSGILTAQAAYTACPNCLDVAVSPDSSSVYASDFSDNLILEFNATPGTAGMSLKSPSSIASTGFNPEGLAISSDGLNLYANNFNSSGVSQYSIGAGGVLANMSPGLITLSGNGVAVEVSNDGQSAYSTSSVGVTQFSRGTSGALTNLGTLSISNNPKQILISKSNLNSYVYVSQNGSTYVSQYLRN